VPDICVNFRSVITYLGVNAEVRRRDPGLSTIVTTDTEYCRPLLNADPALAFTGISLQ